MQVTAADITQLAPGAAGWIVLGLIDHQVEIERHGIDTPLRVCHFMAQIAHESAGFKTTREYATGETYEGRRDLGNTQPGDGKRYRGRGLIQLTGRANYREFGTLLSLPLEGQPELAEQFPAALLVSLAYWRRRDINRHADRDDVVAVTRAINGGTNGLTDRKACLAKAKRIWGVATGSHKDAMDRQRDFLWLGDNGPEVKALQETLLRHGISVGHHGADGRFGDDTEQAVRRWQGMKGLDVDGKAGAKTLASLGLPPLGA